MDSGRTRTKLFNLVTPPRPRSVWPFAVTKMATMTDNEVLAHVDANPVLADFADEKGMTLYLHAAKIGRWELCQVLCSRGASPAHKPRSGLTLAHHIAAFSENDIPAVLEVCKQHNLLTVPDRDGVLPLAEASRHSTPSAAPAVAALLAACPEAALATALNGQNAVHAAVQGGNACLIPLLASSGAVVGLGDEMGTTPLHIAAETNNPCMVDALVAAGAPLDPVNHVGFTPLITAGYSGAAQAAERLLAGGAAAGAVDARRGWTALHAACSCRGGAKAVAVLANTVAVNIRDKAGQLAADLAVSAGHTECAAALGEALAQVGDRAIKAAKESENEEMIELLRKYGKI